MVAKRAVQDIQVLECKRFQWPDRVKKICLNVFAIIGVAFSASHMWQSQSIPQLANEHQHQKPTTRDIYPDAEYPLRPAAEPWDISTCYSYPRNLSTTVSEGTWLRITTHPSKPEIVFDMLGDLYCMETDSEDDDAIRPALPILTGIPYDKEAEFSNDGLRLVFVSDAGFGVDNIWTIEYTNCADMSRKSPEEARFSTVQQTNATFRFFSSPSFHPTEPRIIATKWFLTGRPNGAGEIWEFPVINNTQRLPEIGGRRLIERKLPSSWSQAQYFESQLGVEQARYTPSGDGIVFSRNVRDDLTGKFSYNKDVHAGINAVFMLNTTIGSITELVAAASSLPNKPASPGGANVPRLSHDGRTLAFVRRSGDKEVLVLKDLRSGTVHYVWDGLSYDLSTIPCFMGAYPNYGWTANDRAIVIWSQGQIWKIEIKSNDLGERVARGTPIKLHFEADINVALGPTRYSETRVKECELRGNVQEHSFRGLRSNQKGRRVVFEASGDNYQYDIESRTLAKLDKPGEVCYAPSFVGHNILQACWDSQNLTNLFVTDTGRNISTLVSGLPRGRYVSPVSDGEYMAYVRTGKDYMFGDVEETLGEGVWVGKVRLVPGTVDLTSLRRITGVVSSCETKLDLLKADGHPHLLIQNANSVVQYDIKRDTYQEIARGKTSVEMRAQPSITAFRDFQHVWLTTKLKRPLAAIWSKPGDEDTPADLVRLSQIGGHDITLSEDGGMIFWLLGSRLHTASVPNIMSTCRGGSTQSRDVGACTEPLISIHSINITSIQSGLGEAPYVPLIIANASLIAMSNEDPKLIPNATIVTHKGQIIASGRGSEISYSEDAFVVNAQGGIVLPGFVDVHGHWGGFLSPYPQQSWEMETFLGYGITTIHNPASGNVGGFIERNLIEKGYMYGPRVFVTGDVLYGSTQPSVYTEINSRKDARDALLRVKAEGGSSSFSVKNYQLAARSARQRLLLEAADLDMLVVPEGGWSYDWGLTYFIDGYTSHEHPLPIPELYEDVLSLITASGSSYTPLAVMNYGGIFGQSWIHQVTDIPNDTKLRIYVKHDILESLTEVKQAPKSSYLFFNTTRSTAKLAERGVRTNVGAHGEQPIGHLFHSEMLMMSLGGQSSYDVLRQATIGGATSLGLNASIGSVEAGKLSDLVIYPSGVDTIEKVWERSSAMQYVMRGKFLFDVTQGLVEVWPRQGRKQNRTYINPDE